mmetsp:Transcript_127648/g.342592  ORF Transcript_127648/g.342592 Transcript_127648/m.342592 type:complete len:213 (-) Transcript_127648:68-706(-)
MATHTRVRRQAHQHALATPGNLQLGLFHGLANRLPNDLLQLLGNGPQSPHQLLAIRGSGLEHLHDGAPLQLHRQSHLAVRLHDLRLKRPPDDLWDFAHMIDGRIDAILAPTPAANGLLHQGQLGLHALGKALSLVLHHSAQLLGDIVDCLRGGGQAPLLEAVARGLLLAVRCPGLSHARRYPSRADAVGVGERAVAGRRLAAGLAAGPGKTA